MAEVVTNPLPPPTGIYYSEAELRAMDYPLSRLKPVEPGDLCCHCGGDCDQRGFANGHFKALRIRGHPLCARSTCYTAKWDEFNGRREGCRCGRRKKGERPVT